MTGRGAHELAKVFTQTAKRRAESAMTRVANEFGTVIDTDPLRVLVHQSNLELDEDDFFYATVKAEDLDVDDTVLICVVGNHHVLVCEVGDDAVDKLADRVGGGGGGGGGDTNTILSGTGAPTSGDGDAGDFWIRTSNWTIYGPKVGSSWGSATSLVGPAGAAGAPGSPGSTGPEGPEGPAGPLVSRASTTITSGSLAQFATENMDLALGPGSRLLSISTTRAARVRIYASAAYRTADAGRALGTDPTGDHGLILEVVTTASVLSLWLSPAVDAHTADASANLKVLVENRDPTTGTVGMTFASVPTEA